MMNKHKPDISVVIPSFNSKATIKACLDSVFSQTLDESRYEVIVVDSSSDSTPDLIHNEFPQVKLIRIKEKTLPGPTRNRGIQHAKADLIMFIDSDCIAEDTLLEKMICRHNSGDYSVIGGSVLNGTPSSVVGWVDYLLSFSSFFPFMKERLVSQLPTCNACYRIEVLRKYGFFPSYDFLAEDLILNSRIHKGGGALLFDPSLKVIHKNRTKFSTYLVHQWKLGWSYALALRCADLPGRILITYPALILLIPFRRFGALLWRLLRGDRRTLSVFPILIPFYLIGAFWWAYGFLKGALIEGEELEKRFEEVHRI